MVEEALVCNPLEVAAKDMSALIVREMTSFPVVTSVRVDETNNEFVVEVTVDRFDWSSLEGIYAKERELLCTRESG